MSAFSRGEDLPFTSKLVTELAEALEAVGYSCTSRPALELPSAELGNFVARHLEWAEPDLVQVVHVLSHGESGDGDATVYALGSDGTRHPSGDIAHWLNTVQNSADRPFTLFLLDLCHAGTLARQAWQTKLADSRTRAWVIAATEGVKSAYDGRFTQAIINVLRAAASGELDIDPTREHIPLQVIAPAIRREVNRLTAESDGYHQDVTASVIDISAEVDPPFFPNPRYAPGNRDLALRASLDPGLVPFLDDLDEGLDARHFIERGSGFDGMIGCFAGREAQLKQLSPWLNRHGPGNLGVITGSPGVGKSALLGILVCAAHPKLRARTKNVWDRAAQAPYPIDDGFAAIHARQRSISAITDSLAAQLGLASTNLIDNIRALAKPPVIVVDALDEADNGVAVLNELLIPLSSVARVLVGTRDYDQYRPLLQAADFVVNLDAVEPRILQEDLYRYVSDLLGATAYRDRGAIRGAFATEVARTLATPSDTDWGAFLVAGLYTRYLITSHPTPVTDPTEAELLGRAVPRTLPEVLELDLAAHPDLPWLRPVLSALASAHGQGMPATVLARAATAYTPSSADLRVTLDAARFYLRQATDTDHTTLYRLFHQGLADHLRAAKPTSAPNNLLDRLLDPLGPPGSRDWTAAEPYLLRHAIQHFDDAQRLDELFNDPNFLLSTDPATLEAAANTPALRSTAAVLRHIVTTSPTPAALALNAARADLPDLAARAAKSLSWQPIWATGHAAPREQPVPPLDYSIGYGENGFASRIVCGNPQDTPIAAVIHRERLHFVGLRGPLLQPLALIEGIVDVALSPAHDWRGAAIVRSSRWTRRVIAWHNRDFADAKMITSQRQANAIACGAYGRDMIIVVAVDRQLLMFHPARGRHAGIVLGDHEGPITALACTSVDGIPVAVSVGAGSICVWNLLEMKQSGPMLSTQQYRVNAIACATIDDRPVAITADAHTLRVWDLVDPRELGAPISWVAARSPAWLEAYSRPDGSAVAIVPGDDHVNLWDLTERKGIDAFHFPGAVPAGAFTTIYGDPSLVVATDQGRLAVRKLESKRSAALAPAHGEAPVDRCALIGQGDPAVLVARTNGSVTCRDLATGKVRFQGVSGHGVPLVELREVWLAGEWRVALTDAKGGSRVWDPYRGQVDPAGSLFRARPSAGSTPEIAVPVRDGLRFVVGDLDGHVFVRDHRRLDAYHGGPVTALAAMTFKDRTLVFSGDTDGTVQVCEWNGKRIAVIDGLQGRVDQIEVTEDGYLLIVAGGELVCGRLRL